MKELAKEAKVKKLKMNRNNLVERLKTLLDEKVLQEALRHYIDVPESAIFLQTYLLNGKYKLICKQVEEKKLKEEKAILAEGAQLCDVSVTPYYKKVLP